MGPGTLLVWPPRLLDIVDDKRRRWYRSGGRLLISGMKMSEAFELGGIFCGAGDLLEAVDAGCGSADVRCHGCAQTIFFEDCDCGVPRAACVSARAMQRRARSIYRRKCASETW
jgi:hypothetical protein